MEPQAQLVTVTDLLKQLAGESCFGCLSLKMGSLEWEIALQRDCQIFATHSLDPIEKIDRHLRRLGFQNSAVTGEVREQVKERLSKNLKTLSRVEAECHTIQDLLEQGSVTTEEANDLCKQLTLESLESSFLLSGFQYQFLRVEFTDQAFQWPRLEVILHDFQSNLSAWQTLDPQIKTPYQRPHLSQSVERLSADQHQRLSKLLVGFSFRQLSVVLHQNELKIAQSLQPLIQQGIINLLEPHPPFDQLPSYRTVQSPRVSPKASGGEIYPWQGNPNGHGPVTPSLVKRIVCVDDSPTLLRIVQQYLGNNRVEIYPISDSLQALREIIRLKPNLILLDVGMPGLDGYKLCSRLLQK
jgi:two-component system, chemotaxis family, response regulator PixG